MSLALHSVTLNDFQNDALASVPQNHSLGNDELPSFHTIGTSRISGPMKRFSPKATRPTVCIKF